MITVRVALEADDRLGEAPVWRGSTGELLWVDIARGLLHTWTPDTGEAAVEAFNGEVGAAVLRRDGGLVVAVDHDLVLVDSDHSRSIAGSIEPNMPGNRLNDCRCDPQGRLWIGTMSKTREPAKAGLYRLQPGDEVRCMVPQTTLSNGMGWSPDGESMYFIDSTTQRIDVFDFDGARGEVSARRAFAEIDAAAGLPDGLTVDEEGGVWVGLFGGGAVRRYDPEGILDAVVEVPVPHPTCPGFGGPDLATLFITSTRHRLTALQIAETPLAGSLFACEPGVRGLPAAEFAG